MAGSQTKWLFFILIPFFIGYSCKPPEKKEEAHGQKTDSAFVPFSMEELQKRTFDFFWELSDNPFAQTHDRTPSRTFYSIAATGFGLTSYLIGVEKQYITREEAAQRTLTCLRKMWEMPQSDHPSQSMGYKGLFYHFLTLEEGLRYKNVELSTIDTGLLMAGILSSQVYFDGENKTEQNIRMLADSLYRRVEWDWAMQEDELMSMGWRPQKGFIPARWSGYNEAMILMVLAMGSPTHPIADNAWEKWCEEYEWADFEGYEHLNFSPLFGHQYSQMYIDFRDIQDAYMRKKGSDYFENSRLATLANRAYCINNPLRFNGYDSLSWGLTACDGPRDTLIRWKGKEVRVHGYWARGASSIHIRDDGTLAPTAVGGSVPFAPEVCLPTLEHLWNSQGEKLVGKYGFHDAFNPSYTFGINRKTKASNKEGWYDRDYLGIDQGPILIQTYNHQTDFVWELMKKSPYILRGLQRAGFSGGWLDEAAE